MNGSYLYLKHDLDGFVVRGQTACEFGHRIPLSSSETSEGVFAGWRWDGEQLRAENDRVGFYPLYYFATESEIAISPSIDQLLVLGAPTKQDFAALAVFFRFGGFLGEDTPFSAIRALPPNAVLEWRPRSINLYSKPPQIALQKGFSRDQAIERYREGLRNAIARRAPYGVMALPLSGGRDSRLLLFELLHAGWRTDFCVTHNGTREDDLGPARTLAERVGSPLIAVEEEGPSYAEFCDKTRAVNYASLVHTAAWRIRDRLIGQAETVYDGIGGDTPTTTSTFQTPRRLELFRAGRLDDLCFDILRYSGAHPLMSKQAQSLMSFDVAAQRLRAELARHADQPNPVASFFFWNRTRRNLAQAPYGILGDIPRVYAPFLDREVLDFVMGIPAEEQMDFKFRDDVLRTFYPQYADIPFARKMPPAKSGLSDKRELGMGLLVDILKRGLSPSISSAFLWPRLLSLASGLPHNSEWHWYLEMAAYAQAVKGTAGDS